MLWSHRLFIRLWYSDKVQFMNTTFIIITLKPCFHWITLFFSHLLGPCWSRASCAPPSPSYFSWSSRELPSLWMIWPGSHRLQTPSGSQSLTAELRESFNIAEVLQKKKIFNVYVFEIKKDIVWKVALHEITPSLLHFYTKMVLVLMTKLVLGHLWTY